MEPTAGTKPRALAARVVDRLLCVHPSITDSIDRLRARLLAMLTLLLPLAVILLSGVSAISRPGVLDDGDTITFYLMGLACLAAYGLNRAGRFRAAARLMTMAVTVAAIVAPFMPFAAPTSLTVLLVPVLLAGMLLSARASLWVMAATLGGATLLTYLSPFALWEDLSYYTDTLLILAVVDAAAVVLMSHIHSLEQVRRQELERVNRQLEEDIALRRQVEDRFRLISSLISDYIFESAVTPEGGVVNRWLEGAFERVSGYSREEYRARGGWRACLHPEDRAQDDRDLAELQANRNVVSELRVIHRDGSIRWVRVHARPVWDVTHNRLTAIQGAVQDITEQRLAREALQASEERYRNFVELSVEGIWLLAVDEPIPIDLPPLEQVRRIQYQGYVAECNDALARMYGFAAREDLLGRRLIDLYGGVPDERNTASTLALVEAGYRGQERETVEFDSQGNPVYFLNNAVGVIRGGKLVGVWGTQRDITQRKQAEAEISRLNAELEQRVQDRTAELEAANRELAAARDRALEADHLKSQFLAAMSHELRTPLNAILNFTQFVAAGVKGPVNPQQKDALDKAALSARHLLALINDVLDVSRIEAGALTLSLEDEVSLRAILDEAHGVACGLLVDRPVEAALAVEQPLPDIRCDPRRVRQILLNLVANACKFTEQGRVTIRARGSGDEVLIAVQDTGPGVAAEDQALIFETFRQSRLGLRVGTGTGLGLPISRHLAEAHGGRLWVESQPGHGATFNVALPIAGPPG